MLVPDTTSSEQYSKHPEGWAGFIVKDATDVDQNGVILIRQDGTELAVVTLQPDSGTDRPEVKVWFTLSEPFLWKLKEFQVACGLPQKGGYSWEHFNGKKVRAEIVWNKSKGKTYVNVNAWEPYGNPAQPAGVVQPEREKNDGLPF